MAEQLGVTTETFTPTELVVSDKNLTKRFITLITGQNLSEGALLGRITASGKYTLSLTASSDGSETPRAILLRDTDASSEDLETVVLWTGQVNQNALTYGTGHTAASTEDGLRGLGIILSDTSQRL